MPGALLWSPRCHPNAKQALALRVPTRQEARARRAGRGGGLPAPRGAATRAPVRRRPAHTDFIRPTSGCGRLPPNPPTQWTAFSLKTVLPALPAPPIPPAPPVLPALSVLFCLFCLFSLFSLFCPFLLFCLFCLFLSVFVCFVPFLAPFGRFILVSASESTEGPRTGAVGGARAGPMCRN